MKLPLVTLTREVWAEIATTAISLSREAGGILVGRMNRLGNYEVHHTLILAHQWATKEKVGYNDDEIARTGKVAWDRWKPLEKIGEWHPHLYEDRVPDILFPQISEEDELSILNDQIELIAVTFPAGTALSKSDFAIAKTIGDKTCRAEVYLKSGGKVYPVELRVR